MLLDLNTTGTVQRGRQIMVGDKAVHYLEVGQGRPIVLLHGLGGLAQECLLAFRDINPEGRLVAIDRPGYGLSEALPDAESGPDGQAIWLRDVLDELDIERPLIFAHSIGAATALAFALDNPSRTGGLLMAAPFCRPTRPAAAPMLRLAGLPVLGALIRKFLIPGLADRVGPSRLATIFSPNDVPRYLTDFPFQHAVRSEAVSAMIAELNGYNQSMLRRCLQVRRLRVPTAIVVGGSDDIVDNEFHGEWLGRRIRGARIFRLPGVGHMPHHCGSDALATALAYLTHAASPRTARPSITAEAYA